MLRCVGLALLAVTWAAADEPPSVLLAEMHGDYRHAIAADKKYAGKLLDVVGVLGGVERTASGYSVKLVWPAIEAVQGYAVCQVAADDAKPFADVQVGAVIAVRAAFAKPVADDRAAAQGGYYLTFTGGKLQRVILR